MASNRECDAPGDSIVVALIWRHLADVDGIRLPPG
jgi:hypothetical protein